MSDVGDLIRQTLGNLPGNITLEAMKKIGADEVQELRAEQQTSQLDFMNSVEEATNPLAAKFQKSRKEIKTRFSRIQKMIASGEKAQRLTPIEMMKDTADQYEEKNPELKSSRLLSLREYIKADDSVEVIIKKILEFFPDVSLADEALDFLLDTTEGEFHQNIFNAKESFNQQYGREIIAGRNISVVAREAAAKGLGPPTSLRDMYRDITGNPRDSQTLFQELSQKYAFKDLKKVIDFLLHSLGTDMKSKGPSISRAFLQRLITETRSLQAILGVYRFFKLRMRLVQSLFEKEDLPLPAQLSFELLAKQFMSLAADRYPSADKVLQSANKLGIEKWLIAKIIVFSQMRDAVREVAVNQIYQTFQHRDEVYMALIEALENLEDELEDQEEDNESDDEEEERERKVS